MSINIHCDTIAQFKVLRHLQDNFIDCKSLELIKEGIRFTDITGETADFVYNGKGVVIDEQTSADRL